MSGIELAVSTVIFALRPHPTSGATTLWLPLVRRIREPQLGWWALPGGPLGSTEDLVTSARHTLLQTTGLEPAHLEQLYSFGGLGRAPGTDTRVVSIVYWALVRPDEDARAIDGENVQWCVADEIPPLAFDHDEIVEHALDRLRTKITYSDIALAFTGEPFTLGQLREVHEAVRGVRLDPANFRRQLLAGGTLIDTGTRLEGTSHRPPRLYRRAR